MYLKKHLPTGDPWLPLVVVVVVIVILFPEESKQMKYSIDG